MDSPPTLERMKQVMGSARTGRMFVYFVLAAFICILIGWFISVSRRDKANCDTMNKLYKDFPTLHSIDTASTEYKHNLRDYYIKTAYNACSPGAFKNDFVNICALKDCIRQGARCLDFEVYSMDNKPVVATSAVDDFTVKETYNSVPLADVLTTINDYAFSGSTCPNPRDPLLIHFRIMSANKEVYSKMADLIGETLETRVLGPEYSYENHGKNLGQVPLKDLMGKVVIMADKRNPLFEGTPLDEYVNLATNSIFARSVRFTQGVKFTPDMGELIDYNKKNMSICLPDMAPEPSNPSSALAMSYGCQMIGMCFQDFDSNMEYYDSFFDNNGTAFALKPENLRFIPLTIPNPTPQNPAYSYAKRDVSSDYYSFNI